MQRIVYAMQFRGEAAPSSDGAMHATTSSPSTRIMSTVTPSGISSQVDVIDGDDATFTSIVHMTGDTSFSESGTITFGAGNTLEFSSIGEGYMVPSPSAGTSYGAVSWRIDRGTGQFAGASGIITSNFMFSDTGELTDYQFGHVWID